MTFIHGGYKHGGQKRGGQHPAAASPAPPAPRVQWSPTLSRQSLVHGGWWPRSIDPYAELPGLILAVDDRLLAVTSVMLGINGWDSRPRQIRVADRTIRLSWFTTQPDALLTVMCAEKYRVDLLVIPSATSPAVAEAAMNLATQAANTTPAPKILAEAAAAVARDAADPADGGEA
ncbi:DUF5994 family protein [Actinopolymorpha sp. B11F2]|uniref:DUF5994 family protein n=1 Tax=Actinopolymorpha sp. B11F2 TaxID=3160862 RepID=UPI0032E44396